MPSNLQQLVLATAPAPLLLTLYLLPQPLQDAALHAAFPSITASSSLTTLTFCGQEDYGTAFWQSVGRQTHLEHLHCTSNGTQTSDFPRSMLLSIASLSCLQSLNISGVKSANAHSKSMCLGTASALAGSLACLTGLKDLDLSNNCIWSHSLAVLAPVIAQLKLLATLNMSQNLLQDSECKVLGPAIAKLSHLKALDLSGCDIDESEHLAAHLSACVQLKDLKYADNLRVEHVLRSLSKTACLERLECTVFGCVEKLAECLLSMTRLRCLRMRTSCYWRQEPAIQFIFDISDHLIDTGPLMPSIQYLTALEELHLFNNSKYYKHLDRVVPALQACPLLRSLSLGVCVFSSNHAVELGHLLSKLWHLTELNLTEAFAYTSANDSAEELIAAFSGCQESLSALQKLSLPMFYDGIGNSAVHAMCARFRHSCNLRCLQLTSFCIEGDAEHVAWMLVDLVCLEHLFLKVRAFNDKWFSCLADSFGGLTCLQTLDFMGSRMGDQELKTVGLQLVNLTRLTHLRLRGANTVSIRGEKALSQHLGSLVFLQNLDLSLILSPEGAAAVAPAIGNLTALTRLFLSHNCLRSEGLESLAPHLVKLKCLKELKIDDNMLGREGCNVLVSCLSKMTWLRAVSVHVNHMDGHAVAKLSKVQSPYKSLVIHGLHFQEDPSFGLL